MSVEQHGEAEARHQQTGDRQQHRDQEPAEQAHRRGREAQADLQADQREGGLARAGPGPRSPRAGRRAQRARDDHRAEQQPAVTRRRRRARHPRAPGRRPRPIPRRAEQPEEGGGAPPLPCSPPNSTAIASGVRSTTTSTRRYCMNATSRSSPPSSPDIPTIPDAPPAIIPSSAVGGSSGVVRASTAPAARLSASVAADTASTGTTEPASARNASPWQVRAERHAGDGLRPAEGPAAARPGPAARARTPARAAARRTGTRTAARRRRARRRRRTPRRRSRSRPPRVSRLR